MHGCPSSGLLLALTHLRLRGRRGICLEQGAGNDARRLSRLMERVRKGASLSGLCTGVPVFRRLLLTCQSRRWRPNPEQFGPSEVRSYAAATGASEIAAAHSLVVQEEATSAGLRAALEGTEETDFAGVWFNAKSSEFVVPVVEPGQGRQVQQTLSEAGLPEDSAVVEVPFTWSELEIAQESIDTTLAPLLSQGLAMTSLNPKRNAVVVDLAQGASAGQRAEANRAARERPSGQIVVRTLRISNLDRKPGLHRVDGRLQPASQGRPKNRIERARHRNRVHGGVQGNWKYVWQSLRAYGGSLRRAQSGGALVWGIHRRHCPRNRYRRRS